MTPCTGTPTPTTVPIPFTTICPHACHLTNFSVISRCRSENICQMDRVSRCVNEVRHWITPTHANRHRTGVAGHRMTEEHIQSTIHYGHRKHASPLSHVVPLLLHYANADYSEVLLDSVAKQRNELRRIKKPKQGWKILWFTVTIKKTVTWIRAKYGEWHRLRCFH